MNVDVRYRSYTGVLPSSRTGTYWFCDAQMGKSVDLTTFSWGLRPAGKLISNM